MMEVSELKEALPQAASPVVHVEICQKSQSNARENVLREAVRQMLCEKPKCFRDMMITKFTDPVLEEHVTSVSIGDTDCFISDKKMGVNLLLCRLHMHVYTLSEEGPGQEDLEDDGELAAAHHWLLPNTSFQGIWESLVFDSQVKSQLLQYTSTTLLFSDRKVDTNIIAWNRVILLHGPPGTGKTSLCKALAQKLSINLSDRYSYGQLIEINSHSLFSKWFSESGKLVMKMFQKIQELIDDKDALVCVLIDEVESLTAARKSAMSGNEPSDAIRVVNALLTQLDKIKENPNVLILTTSNITGAIDLAFVDRADIKQYIGPPTPSAIYKIYYSCIAELKRAEIIDCEDNIFELDQLEVWKGVEHGHAQDSKVIHDSQKLWTIAVKSEGLSGRTLRKLPFIAHAIYLQATSVSREDFLEALSLAVDKQFKEREDMDAQ